MKRLLTVFICILASLSSFAQEDSAFDHLEPTIRKIDKIIVRLYKQKKLDSLARIFPGYKKFEKEIKESLNVVGTNNHYEPGGYEDEKDPNKKWEEHTFFTAEQNAKIAGRVSVMYTISGRSIKVLRYQYLIRSEINDRDRLEKEWNEPNQVLPADQ